VNTHNSALNRIFDEAVARGYLQKSHLPVLSNKGSAPMDVGKKVRFCNGKGEASKSGIHYNGSETTPVARFSPNSLGLYDMSGNVYEWTCSEYKESCDGNEQKCVVSAGRYSLRGGSRYNDQKRVRAAFRYGNFPGDHGTNFEFRLARDN
jgi:formylglycine-generating enzyme required for sulfatase activity